MVTRHSNVLGFDLVEIMSNLLGGLTMTQTRHDFPDVLIILVFRSVIDRRHSNGVPKLPKNVTDELPLIPPTLLFTFVFRQ